MSNGDLGAGLCLVLHLTKSDTEVSIPLNPVLPCVMGKWDCCIANWCSLVNCRKETEETDIRRVTQPKLKHIQIGKCRAPDPQSWLLLKLWQRLRNGAGITILGTGTRRWYRNSISTKRTCAFGVCEKQQHRLTTTPCGLFNEGVCSHCNSCPRDKHRQAG